MNIVAIAVAAAEIPIETVNDCPAKSSDPTF